MKTKDLSHSPQKHTDLTRAHMLNVSQSLIHVISASSVLIMQAPALWAPRICIFMTIGVYLGVCVCFFFLGGGAMS